MRQKQSQDCPLGVAVRVSFVSEDFVLESVVSTNSADLRDTPNHCDSPAIPALQNTNLKCKIK